MFVSKSKTAISKAQVKTLIGTVAFDAGIKSLKWCWCLTVDDLRQGGIRTAILPTTNRALQC